MSAPDSPVSSDIRFLLDEHVDVALARELRRRQPGIDVQTTVEAGTRGLKDPALLAWAADHDHILVTHDKRTMPDHFYDFMLAGHSNPGIILVPRDLPLGRIIEDLLLIWEASTAEEYRDLITRLPL